MKTRTNKIARTAVRRGRFALHPLSFAICLGLSGAALALPQGGKVVAGDATISKPSTDTEVIRQTTDKAIIDWKSFSIAAGEKVRFYQPSSTSVTLNRVTGYDPSYILGQMSSNGKIFLVNPYGVVFGAGARVDVGGLVVSTLSIANNDFLAGRYSLTSVDPAAPAERGAIRNEGTISAPGGLVVLAGPSVTNTGTIVANGGRVGLVAANAVSVDVEGDGLLFFQTSATEAKNRLEQLGRIQADGGTVEMRAAARGAFADTVLNMAGVVQAKTIGTRAGRIVIDGGSEGVTAISGRLDVSGAAAGERGGAITVQGQYVLLDNGARIEASGDAGGGSIRVGGDFHGANPEVRNADKTVVMPDAEMHADAITRGDGGSLVVWADDSTRYYGTASAKGGAQGGNGGNAEVSGKQNLLYEGLVDLAAPRGAVGNLLLDPTNFTIAATANSGTLVNTAGVFTDPLTTPSNVTPATLQLQLAASNVTVDTASGLLDAGTINVVDPVSWGTAFNLTLKATTTIAVNGAITNTGTGGLNLFADGGANLNAAVQLAGGGFKVAGTAGGVTRAASFTAGVGGTINTTAAGRAGGAVDIATTGNISTRAITTSGGAAATVGLAAGAVTLNSNAGSVTTNGLISAVGSNAAAASGLAGGNGGPVTISGSTGATLAAGITTTGGAGDGAGAKGAGGAVSLTGGGAGGATVNAGVTVNADDATIAVNGGGTAIQLNTSTLTTTNNTAAAITVRNATTVALGNLTTGATGTTTLGVGGDITAAVTQTAATAITTGTLAGSTAGSVTLGNANAIATLGAFTSNGAFALNDLGGGLTVSGAVSTSNNGVASIATSGGNLSVGASGSVAGAGVTLTTTGANDIALGGAVNGNAGTVTLNSGQAVTQTAAGTINTTGALTITAAGAITLDQGNTIGSLGAVSRGGAFTLNDTGGGLTLTGDITGGTTNNAVSITTAGGALDLGAHNITTTTGAGNLTLGGAGVTQTGAGTINAGGNTVVNAGAGVIDLQSTTNDFIGTVTLNSTGASAAIQDTNALTLLAPTLGANTGLTAIAGTTLTLPAGAISTGTGNINLQANGGSLTTPGTLTTTSGSITLVGATGLTVANGVTTTSGPISLTGGAAGGLIINTGVTVDAGNSTITANGGGAAIQLNDSTLTTTNNTASAITVRNATTANLGNLTTGATGTTTLGVAGDITGALTQTALTGINSGTLTASTSTAAGTITLDKANTITNLGAVTRGGAFTLVDAGGLTLTGSVSGGTTTNAVSITTTGLLDLGANNITATTGAGNLTLAGVGVTQTLASTITAGGATTVNAGAGVIDLQSTTNDFTGAVTLNATGASAAVRDANALTLAVPTLGANTGLTAIAGTTLTLPAGAINTGLGNLDLRSLGGALATPGNLTAANISLTGSAGLTLSNNLNATGVTLNTTNAPITQTAGTISSSGTTTANAGTGSISLALAGNDFSTFAATGNAVTVRDDNGLALGAIAATTLTLDTSVGNGPVTQTGAAVVTGATTITAGGGSVTLTNAGNDFANIGVTGGAVSITDINALALNAINATGLTVNTSAGNGNVTQNAAAVVSGATAVNAGSGAVTLTNVGNNFGSVGATGGAVSVTDVNALALDAINATSLTLTAGGAITQNAAAVVTAATTANAGANAITLTNAGNNFGSVGATGGAVSITDSNALALDAINATSLTLNTAAGNGNITQNAAAIVGAATTVNAGSGAVTLTNAGNNFASVAAIGGAVSITDINALTLGAINATSLTVDTSAGNGAVIQTAGAVVSGLSTVNAGTGTVTLTNAGNDFATLGVTGGAVSIVDSNALTLSSLTSAPNQAVSVSAGGVLTLPATAIDTGTADLTLTSGGTLTTVATLRGTNVALASSGAMTLANNVTALGTLGLTTTNAAIQQTGGTILASGTTTVSAGTGDITLAQPTNNFQGNVLLSGGAVSVRDIDNLTVLSLVSGANRPVSLIAGGSLVLPAAAIDTGTADLTLQALGGSLAINGPLNGNTVTLTGTTGLTLGANITSSGDQIYTSTVQLASNVALNSGASKIDLQGGANGGGNNLSLTSSNAAADAIHTGAAITNTAQFTVTGNSTLGGNVTTTGTQTYTGPIVLGTDVALAAGAAKIDLQGAVNAAGHNLALTSSNAAADAIRAEAAITNAAQLIVTGKSTLASGITTTGTQLYTDTVTLGSGSNFVGSSLSFGNGIVAGTFDLGLQSDTLTLNGAVVGSGNAALSSVTQNASVGVAGAAGTLQLSQATLDKFAGFGSTTVGRADGSGDLTFGNLVLPTHFTVQSASGNANFTGTVASAAGQSRNLTVTTGGTTTFGGAVGGPIGGPAALGNLTVAGATSLNANTTTNGSQSFGGPVTVGADATLSASAVSFGNSLDIGSHAVTIQSDALSIAGAATGSGAGSVRVAPKDAAGSIGVAGAAGTLQVSQGLINTLAGIPTLTLGRADSTGAVTVGNLILPADLAIGNGSSNVAFTGTVDSAAGPARDLVVTTTGTTSFSSPVGATRAIDVLSVSGATQIGASIVTSGAQTYTGATTLLVDSTLTGPSVSFGSTVDGARALTVNAAATNFAAAVGGTTALTSLTTDAAGTTQLGGNVTSTGAQTYNDALQLNADAVLSGTTLNLAGSVDGAHTLAVNGSTGVTLGSAIGTTTPLTGLSVSGPLQLTAGAVTTTGAQTYAGKVTLGAATVLTAPSIAFGNTLDGAFALTLQSAGPTSFATAVGATTALASLSANGGGAVQLAGPSVDTTGAQSYSGALQLTGNSRLTGSALTLTGPVSGATDLTLQTNSLTGGTSIAGTGVLTITPIDPTLSIGVAGGAGALQVAQAVLDGAPGFTGHVIGRNDGSGTVSAGNLVLRADTTLQTASSDMNLGGSVDGGFALTLNSGGTTRITGPVGVTTALKSLTTDNNAAAADWNGTTGERTTFDTADGTGRARVITTGAQTYNDPVTASVPIAFTGGAITATQATNRFDGGVSANAASLDLRSSTDLQLGAVTLLNGGAVETDGILHLTGALQLNGGTLILTSNATPTPIDLTDPEFAGKTLTFGFVPIKEASATIVQDTGATLGSAAGSLLVLRSPAGGSLHLDGPGNTLLGQISAVSGTLGDNDVSRFNNATALTLGFIRIASSEIHVTGRPPSDGNQTLTQAGLEGDVIKLTADILTTGTDGLIRSRLPFNNVQGSQTSIPGLTLALSPTALANGGGFGTSTSDTFIQIQVGGAEGGFITARPKGASGNNAVIFLGGNADVRPFYDGTGKLTEIRIFYNGDAPRTPQEAGALAAVIALIEEARHARFEEAVRTENVSSRLRSGVIAEVGAGRPATVGRESIRLPDTCDIKPKTLLCDGP